MTIAALIPAANDDYSLSLSIPAIAPYVDQVVVFDDGSVDQTPVVLAAMRERFSHLRVITSADGVGWAEARNRLIAETTADRLLFIDADDIFCEQAVSLLYRLMKSTMANVRLGLYESVGDFQHGTGRGFRRPHYDRCHCYINRNYAGHVTWRMKNTYTFPCVETGVRGTSGGILFCHAKGVKSDWRLAWRSQVRPWLRGKAPRHQQPSNDDELHRAVTQGILYNKTNPLKPLPSHIIVPAVCQEAPRFEVVYQNGIPIDRIDRGFAP